MLVIFNSFFSFLLFFFWSEEAEAVSVERFCQLSQSCCDMKMLLDILCLLLVHRVYRIKTEATGLSNGWLI